MAEGGVRDATDIMNMRDKNQRRNKQFEATLPPAHTEQIMRELKQSGHYISRDISREGVYYEVIEHTPTTEEIEYFNRRLRLYRRIKEAFNKYGRMNEGPKEAGALYGVNGDIQADAKRYLFNMRLPGVIKQADAAIARGEKVVSSLISVSEGGQGS